MGVVECALCGDAVGATYREAAPLSAVAAHVADPHRKVRWLASAASASSESAIF